MSVTALSESIQKFMSIDESRFRAALQRVSANSEFPVQHPSTGTEDDDDEPEDEHDDENEASQHEKRDTTEYPEEIQRDDEDRG